MDIIKVLALISRNIVLQWEYLKKHLQINAVCTGHISVLLNTAEEVYRLKIFNVLYMHLE